MIKDCISLIAGHLPNDYSTEISEPKKKRCESELTLQYTEKNVRCIEKVIVIKCTYKIVLNCLMASS